jgi:hypothetical protein
MTSWNTMTNQNPFKNDVILLSSSVFFFVFFLIFWRNFVLGDGVTIFDMLVCSQWIASIIAHCDELVFVEIVAYKNTDITVGY